MSDYLWDKTGEPDEEIERLEGLLGGFAHKPRALELPAEAAPRPTLFAHARRSRPALVAAAAAALVLMTLAGAVVMLRQNGGEDIKHSADARPPVLPPKKESVVTPPEEPKPSPESPKGEGQATQGSVLGKGPKMPDDQASAGERRRSSTGSRSNRHARQVAAAQEPRTVARQEPPAPTQSERQAAKEQLVYAMRLASAKLGEVRKMTRGPETPRQSFDERNRIR